MQVVFKIVRQDQNAASRVESYSLEVEPGTTILDCLNRIKWEQDGTLAYRKNCRNTICGSCSMRINGRSALACKENVGSEVARFAPDAEIPEITIAPMGNMPVIKDLVVDMSSFWANLKAVDPYVSTASRQIPEREFLQSPEERDKLNQTGNCIMCGACYSECNAREVNPNFVGPHALAKAYRMVEDSRDDRSDDRLDKYNQSTDGVWGCTRCYYCNAVCPMEVAPMDQIGKIKQEILARKTTEVTRSIRHRRTLIDLVKKGGWIDERQFGLQVVANNFRDLGGLISLAPLGVRMLTKRKLPMGFEPSEGVKTVRSLIESVQAFEAQSKR
ncbi:succinate dehydrogenase iron-sulfur subunit [Leptolyngbya boryana NIES-2135]|jgi:succinate dehydrogenase / fumarate reductase iron-sulfur subunit|uniref:succinate dehydrogenase n=1 Tax=Leptolyngbya boryana NIES-2135 TaxID=1973484 RepID=A0A1Z4JNN5_LEPBY|nr:MULTISPECIES: succinate dehydrogenase/fumarate reductase iron-sulfur subunit [Leptolyngbya]BAY58257.1 succinate dehydrogenase iron-sulfur subunit [Leptolyngbya boryana NIES-2135]MBD2367932.1 succinate dehydrogenase/fumarate reductase iron-sulfur subunit [Leptolyngbya sp. FACHB-161]MBD2374456.1 succinate dehydrogenase/fumarate reductase iron-sulfur subunit [Leptolyngbya sp. FACHB-238]MBD2398878.1 succinate dehydrogenase/fumarate reductase iron-sulfur subunit [Leptolyngbya sp. FACHB-239]MBD24